MNIRFGIFSDLHCSLEGLEERGHSRRAFEDMQCGMARFAAENADFAISLGDNVQPALDQSQQYAQIKAIVRHWSTYGLPVHAVHGNHEFQQLTVNQILEIWQTDRTYYSFELQGARFVILDSNIRPDGVHYSMDDFDWRYGIISQDQLHWLEQLLQDKKRTFIFTHSNLYFDPNVDNSEWFQVANHNKVVEILAQSGCVDTVFQGHCHIFWQGIHQGIRFVNIPSPILSEAFNEKDFPIIHITDNAVLYNGIALI